MQHSPDFERDRERREGSRASRDRDEERFERGRERTEPDELQYHGREHEDYGSRPTGGAPAEHQQYSQTYGNSQTGRSQAGNQGYGYGGQCQYGRDQLGQGQLGRSQFGDPMSRPLEPGRGRFRGMGPKDWVRSDERIREEVCELLADSDDVDATNITVKVESGEVILDGTVDSRFAKREADEVACRARGVKDCLNHLRVKSESTEAPTGRGKEAGNGHQARASRSSAGMTSRATT